MESRAAVRTRAGSQAWRDGDIGAKQRCKRIRKRLISSKAPMQTPVESLIARCPPGQSLQGEFYSGEEIYRLDLDRIWRTGWLFAGHSCEIRNRGQYFTVELDT